MTNRKQRLIECVKPLIHTHTHKCTLKKVEEESEGVEHPLKKTKKLDIMRFTVISLFLI